MSFGMRGGEIAEGTYSEDWWETGADGQQDARRRGRSVQARKPLATALS